MKTKVIETDRLILRTWKKEDIEVLFSINQDPQVIAFLHGAMTLKQVNDFILSANRREKEYGYTVWAAELKKTNALIGFIGLNYIDWHAHFTPAVEIGWRLGSQHWGNGYATEGAKAVLNYGFKQLGLAEIVAFTVPANARSIRVMEKIKMRRDPDGDFLHPQLESDHPLSKHVLYRIQK